MDKKLEIELTNTALKIEATDKQATKAFLENNLEEFCRSLFEFGNLKKSLKTYLINQPTIRINNKTALSIIKKISSGPPFQSDKFIKTIENASGEEFISDALDDGEISDLANDLYLSWYSHYDYIEGLYKIRGLILGTSVPDNLDRFVDEARQCYAFQRYNAVYSLCRTILEVSIQNICERKKIINRNRENVYFFDRYKVSTLIDKVSRGSLKDRIRDIYGQTSFLVHGNKVVNAEEAENMLLDTIKTVEMLYEYNGY
jgi:hypothetical protein